MSLQEELQEKRAKTVRTNPEKDAELDKFIEQNPDLHRHYQDLSKDDLVRVQMMRKMKDAKYMEEKSKSLVAWVNANPEVKEAIEARIKNVPAEKRQSAFLRVAKEKAAEAGIQAGHAETGTKVKPAAKKGVGV